MIDFKKIKLCIYFLIFTFSINAFTLDNSILRPKDYIQEILRIANMVQSTSDTSYKILGTTVADKCTVFLSEDMFLGSNGTNIYNSFIKHSEEFPNLMNGGQLNRICSKYSKNSVKNKALLWVIILTMMSHFESSCNINANTAGPNGTANGLYQLHKGREDKYDYDLNLCKENASKSYKLSNLCTLAMLEVQFEKQKGKLFSNKSYWDVLRKNGAAQKADDIYRTITRSSLCNPVNDL